MKKAYYYILMLPFLTIISGTNPSAQIPCITCPADTSTLDAVKNGVREAAGPFRDSIFSQLARITAKQDSISNVVDSVCMKNKITIRREYITMFPRNTWRYDWYYRNGLFFKLQKTQL